MKESRLVKAVVHFEDPNSLLLKCDTLWLYADLSCNIVEGQPFNLVLHHQLVGLVASQRGLFDCDLVCTNRVPVDKFEEAGCQIVDVDILISNFAVCVEDIANVLNTHHETVLTQSKQL